MKRRLTDVCVRAAHSRYSSHCCADHFDEQRDLDILQLRGLILSCLLSFIQTFCAGKITLASH